MLLSLLTPEMHKIQNLRGNVWISRLFFPENGQGWPWFEWIQHSDDILLFDVQIHGLWLYAYTVHRIM